MTRPRSTLADGGTSDAAGDAGADDTPRGPDAVDIEAVHGAFSASFGFVAGNALSVVAVSLAWVLASLPLVTVGPATLGAYTAVASIRADGSVDRAAVVRAMRDHGVDALLLGGVVVLMSGVSLLYVAQFVRTEAPVAGVLGVAGLYATVHLVLVLVPTFVGLAAGVPLSEAVRTSYRWTISHSVAALSTLLLTGLLLALSLVLTVAFVLVFPAVAAWFHTELLAPLYATDTEPVSGAEDRSGSAEYAGPRGG
ncbi:hypothetical protein [Halosimplex salinum]|uniref:hypothetical protein n=1 Tax=Halosimplex salinum TaxID=1710538 RepID=UPI000F4A2A8B|nr:hypothetical protein [Halosimplex salinum]